MQHKYILNGTIKRRRKIKPITLKRTMASLDSLYEFWMQVSIIPRR